MFESDSFNVFVLQHDGYCAGRTGNFCKEKDQSVQQQHCNTGLGEAAWPGDSHIHGCARTARIWWPQKLQRDTAAVHPLKSKTMSLGKYLVWQIIIAVFHSSIMTGIFSSWVDIHFWNWSRSTSSKKGSRSVVYRVLILRMRKTGQTLKKKKSWTVQALVSLLLRSQIWATLDCSFVL